jgi:hypothetical protein
MAKYVALLTGSGYGCDYTIGCNKNFEVFTANDESEAIKRCRQKWEDYSKGEPRIESIQLFLVEATIEVPVRQWNEQGEADSEKAAAEAELAQAEEKARKLREKLGKA